MADTVPQAPGSLRGRQVRVHWNLHKKLASVVDPGTRRVIAHVRDITLTDVTFHAQRSGTARIRRSQHREVCAYAIGRVQDVASDPDVTGWTVITFNPYRGDTFTTRGGQPVDFAALVVFRDAYGYAPPPSLCPLAR